MDDSQSLQPTFRGSPEAQIFEPVELPPPPGDPSPEEIRQRCREIQAEWTPAQEAHRRLWIPHACHGPDHIGEAEALERVRRWMPPGAKKHAH